MTDYGPSAIRRQMCFWSVSQWSRHLHLKMWKKRWEWDPLLLKPMLMSVCKALWNQCPMILDHIKVCVSWLVMFIFSGFSGYPKSLTIVQRLLFCSLGPRLISEMILQQLRNLPRISRSLLHLRLLKSWHGTWRLSNTWNALRSHR